MAQTVIDSNQEWLKVLGKGMVTLPKQWREELGLQPGDIVKAKKEGHRVVIETLQGRSVPYRVYSRAEIEKFLKEDRLPQSLVKKVRRDLLGKTSS